MHGPIRFATIVKVDGGGRDYLEARPFRDDELRRLAMPMLIENHGAYGMAVNAAMGERLEAFGTPVEQFDFTAAPHSATLPRHRWRSLSVNVDWYRFWLQGYEDSDPAKSEQYARWRAMRAKAGDGEV